MLPTPGETAQGGRFTFGQGGKGANQAVAAAQMGATTYLIGSVGDDEPGRSARASLRDANVDDTYVANDVTQPTGTALVMVADDGENLIAVAPGANSSLTDANVRTAMRAIASEVTSGVLLASMEVPSSVIETACSEAQKAGWTVILNPAPAQTLSAGLLSVVDVLVPNAIEARQLHEDGVEGLLRAGVKTVIVTRGSAGAQIMTGEGCITVPAFDVRTVDTTGAGDAFCGALASALATGIELPRAVLIGAAAGAWSTTGVGARSSMTVDDVLRLVATRERPKGSDTGAGPEFDEAPA